MIIYTVITNNYDDLKEPRVVTPGWRYICFTDKPLQSEVWEIHHIDNIPGIDRKIKIKAHDYFDDKVSIYIDGSFLIKGNLDVFISTVKTRFSLCIYQRFDCLYQEAELLVRRGMVDIELWNAQKRRYQQEGFPAGWGLGRNGILVRDLSHPEVQDINERWWEEYQRGVKRDQLSLMYCFWATSSRPDFYKRRISRPFFKQKKHNVY